MTESTRADRFVQELAELKIPDPAAGRGGLWPGTVRYANRGGGGEEGRRHGLESLV